MVPLSPVHFSDYTTDFPGPRTIQGIKGTVNVVGKGTITIRSPDSGISIVIHNVFHMLELQHCLLLVGKLCGECGCKILVKENSCFLFAPSGFAIHAKFAPSYGAQSYLFRFAVSFPEVSDTALALMSTTLLPTKAITKTISEDQISLWHARVGHVATSTLCHLARVGNVPQSYKSAFSGDYPDIGVCEACLEGKQSRFPYPSTIKIAMKPLQLIHSDTGYVPVRSLKGYMEIVTFTDHAVVHLFSS